MCEKIRLSILKYHLLQLSVRKIVRSMKKRENEIEQKKVYHKVQDLYIDVDGVIVDLQFPECEPYPQLVPDAIDFLKWAILSFENVYYLTCWPHQAIKERFPSLPQLQYCEWRNNKTENIDYTRSFYWLEDGITSEERKILESKGGIDNYVFIDPYNREALTGFMQKCDF